MLTSEANNLMESSATAYSKTAKDQLWLIQWDVVHGGNLTGFWGEGKSYGQSSSSALGNPENYRIAYFFTDEEIFDEGKAIILSNLEQLYLLKPIEQLKVAFCEIETEEAINKKRADWFFNDETEIPRERKNEKSIIVSNANYMQNGLNLKCGIKNSFINIIINSVNYRNELPKIIAKFNIEMKLKIEEKITALKKVIDEKKIDSYLIFGKALESNYEYACYEMSKKFEFEDNFINEELVINKDEPYENLKEQYKDLLLLDAKIMKLENLIKKVDEAYVWNEENNSEAIDNLIQQFIDSENFPKAIKGDKEFYQLLKKELLKYIGLIEKK